MTATLPQQRSSRPIGAHRAEPTGRVRAVVRTAGRDQLARGSVMLMAATVGNSALGYLFWILASHRFSASDVGAANAVLSAGMLAALAGDVGLRTLMMQELPQARDATQWSRRVSAAVVLGTASSLVTGLVAWAVLMRVSPQVRGFLGGAWPAVLVALTVTSMLFGLLDGIATAERRTGALLLRNLLNSVAKIVLLGLAVAVLHAPGQAVVLVTALAYAIGIGYGFAVQLRASHAGWRFSFAGIGATLRDVRGSLLGHHVLNLGGQLPMFVMPLEVVARLSAQQNAYMSLTWMVGGIFFMISPAVSTALFVQGRWEPAALRDTTRRAVWLIAALLVPAGLFLIGFGRWVLGLIGAEYAHAGYSLLVLLIASAVPDAITNVKTGHLRACGRLAAGAGLNLGMGIAALVLTWFLLPPMGIAGCGVAWGSAQLGGAVWTWWDGWRQRSSGRALA